MFGMPGVRLDAFRIIRGCGLTLCGASGMDTAGSTQTATRTRGKTRHDLRGRIRTSRFQLKVPKDYCIL
jgi:hypothetical protein